MGFFSRLFGLDEEDKIEAPNRNNVVARDRLQVILAHDKETLLEAQHKDILDYIKDDILKSLKENQNLSEEDMVVSCYNDKGKAFVDINIKLPNKNNLQID